VLYINWILLYTSRLVRRFYRNNSVAKSSVGIENSFDLSTVRNIAHVARRRAGRYINIRKIIEYIRYRRKIPHIYNNNARAYNIYTGLIPSTLTRKLNDGRKCITICTRRFYDCTYQNIIYIMCTNGLVEVGVSARWIIASVNCFGSTTNTYNQLTLYYIYLYHSYMHIII